MPEISNVGLGIPRYPNRGFAINQTLLNTISTDTGPRIGGFRPDWAYLVRGAQKESERTRLLRTGPSVEEENGKLKRIGQLI